MTTYMIPLTTKVPLEIRDEFSEIATSLGATPSSALRMLAYAFVNAGGFPYDMKIDNGPKLDILYPLEKEAAQTALKTMQKKMAGKAQEAGLSSDDDVVDMIMEMRYGRRS